MDNLISVICTVKNGETTIRPTIESVLYQSYQNLELVIIDDGSTDNTLNILNEYKAKDDRTKIYKTGGIGRAEALNMAIKKSSGKYIANIDADDLFHPQKLEIQEKLYHDNQDVFLISTNDKIIYDDELPVWNKEKNNQSFELKNVTKKLLFQNDINHPSVMMRRDLLDNLNGYNEKRKTQVDYDLWLRAFTVEYRMLIVKQELFAKRIHTKQSYENKKRLRYTVNSMLLKLKYISKNKKFYMLPIPVIIFILAQLPYKVRRVLSSVISRD